MSNLSAEKKLDGWLCASVVLYVANLSGWAAYVIWRILNG